MSLPAKLIIEDLEFHAFHGCFPHEATFGQKFALDLTIDLDVQDSALTDQLAAGLDYGQVIEVIHKLFVETRYNLIEGAAHGVAAGLLRSFSQITDVCVRVKKISPPLPEKMRYVAIEISLDRDMLAALSPH